jgi:putative DNA primase/helicase
MIEFDQVNYHSSFTHAMEAAGIRPLEPIAQRLASGELVRFRAEGDKPGRKNGWARLFIDSRAGVFGHFRLGISTSWSLDRGTQIPSEFERCEIAERIRRQEAERVRERERIATLAMQQWHSASPASSAHAYLKTKELTSFGIRQYGNVLLVPMWDARFRLRNVQRIAPDGAKRFMPGGQTKELFWHHGVLTMGHQLNTFPIVIAEGFATAAAIYEATGYAVVAAMSGMNLEAVSVIIRKRFPNREIIVAADYDGNRSDNVGVIRAKGAAEAVGAKVAYPLDVPTAGNSAGCNIDFADIPRTDAAALIEAARNTKAIANE